LLTNSIDEAGVDKRQLWVLARRLVEYAGGLFVRGLEVLGKFGLYFFAARRLGGHDSGLLFFCLTWVNLASAAARLGLERTLTRLLAAEIGVGHGRAARATLLVGLKWCTISGLAWSLLTAVLAGVAAVHLFGQPELGSPLRVSALLLIPQTLAITVGYALMGVKRSALGQLVANALPPVLVLVALLAGVRDLNQILIAYALANAAAALVGLGVLMHDRLKFEDNAARAVLSDGPPVALPGIWQTALPLLTVELVSVAMISLPLLLLAAYAEPEEVGAFSVASRLSSLVWMIIVSIGTIAAPRIAEHYRRREYAELASLNRLSRLVATVCCLPPVIAMLTMPTLLLSLIGPGFSLGRMALIAMSIGQLINCLLPFQEVTLSMTGHGHALRLISVGQLILGAVAGIVLIPMLGSTGAGITTALCISAGAVVCMLTARRLVPQAF
jgi:O-antigen/teichoic acid export membrane protein